MKDGFIKIAAASPALRVGDCAYNADEIVKTAWRASVESAKILVLPELAVTGYTCGDLFFQRLLLDSALNALRTICEETSDLDILLVVGVPLLHKAKLYNCAAVVQKGMVLGLVPKTHLPAYGEFYETRQFAPAFSDIDAYENESMHGVPMGTNLLFQCEELPGLRMAAEICEDLWAPSPPSARHAAAGANLIVNLSASDETAGKAAYRRLLVESQSARLVCGYVYADAGCGESTTDMVFAGHNLIAENGAVLAEALPFSGKLAISEVDIDRLNSERHRLTTFPSAQDEHYLTVPFELEFDDTVLTRPVAQNPFLPEEAAGLAGRCETIFNIQAAGLAKRLEHTGIQTALLGISGGLDSTLALLATARAYTQMQRPLTDILAVTMPGFGTTNRTKNNATALCAALGVSLLDIDITKSVQTHFEEIGHDPNTHDTVFENAQARMRTMVLMDLANAKNGLVVGTGDLSELALGWATYNGDHMSMYGLNASVPKTLVRHMIAHEASVRPELAEILQDILDTPVSPELLPSNGSEITQKTEQILGPYEVHDFFMYHMLRWGFTPAKILRLAKIAFGDEYAESTLLEWMTIFYKRFFSQQFKRNCLPDGPKIGSVTLSPRGDWRMPSDAVSAGWMREIERLQNALKKKK